MTTIQRAPIAEKGQLDFWGQYLCQPLWLAVLTFAAALLFMFWMASRSRSAQQVAERNVRNAARSRLAAMELATLIPPQLTGDSGQKISALVDHALQSASISDRQLRTQSIRTMGIVGQTGISRLQAHVEITQLSLAQAGSIVQAIEQSGEPVWIESSGLMGLPQNQWNLVLEIDWLQRQSN